MEGMKKLLLKKTTDDLTYIDEMEARALLSDPTFFVLVSDFSNFSEERAV
jgi:hypothetical protein